MDSKHVRVIEWFWDFCSKIAHGLHDQILKKKFKVSRIFFHIGRGRQWMKKAVNVITLTLMAVDKGGGVKPLSTKGG